MDAVFMKDAQPMENLDGTPALLSFVALESLCLEAETC
jgi:hypothetical protein